MKRLLGISSNVQMTLKSYWYASEFGKDPDEMVTYVACYKAGLDQIGR